jgi:hypothetical protein
MTWALWLLLLQGILGALDTLYYHEWRGRLVAYSPRTSPELRLHAARDGIYAIIWHPAASPAWRLGAGANALQRRLSLLPDSQEDAAVWGASPRERGARGMAGCVERRWPICSRL